MTQVLAIKAIERAMRSLGITILSLVAASLVIASPADAGIDSAYTKPSNVSTWGQDLRSSSGIPGLGRAMH